MKKRRKIAKFEKIRILKAGLFLFFKFFSEKAKWLKRESTLTTHSSHLIKTCDKLFRYVFYLLLFVSFTATFYCLTVVGFIFEK